MLGYVSAVTQCAVSEGAALITHASDGVAGGSALFAQAGGSLPGDIARKLQRSSVSGVPSRHMFQSDVSGVPLAALLPYCDVEDLFSWASVQRQVQEMLTATTVWCQLLQLHFPAAFKQLDQKVEQRQKLVTDSLVGFPVGHLRELYVKLSATSRRCVLGCSGRLALEWWRVKDVRSYEKCLAEQQQAHVLLKSLGCIDSAMQLHGEMLPDERELVDARDEQVLLSNISSGWKLTLEKIRGWEDERKRRLI